MNTTTAPTTAVPIEIQEQAATVLEKYLENFVAHAIGSNKYYEIRELETNFAHPEYMEVKVYFRQVSPIIPMEGKPA